MKNVFVFLLSFVFASSSFGFIVNPSLMNNPFRNLTLVDPFNILSETEKEDIKEIDKKEEHNFFITIFYIFVVIIVVGLLLRN